MENIEEVNEAIPATPEQQAQKFMEEYNKLCEKYGLHLVGTPQYQQSHGGTFVTKIALAITPINQ